MFGFLAGVFVIAALATLVIGFGFITQATMGVAIIGAAAVLAIIGRIAQAQSHFLQQMEVLDRIELILGITRK